MKNFNEIYENIYKQSYEMLNKERKKELLKEGIIIVIAIVFFIIMLSVYMGGKKAVTGTALYLALILLLIITIVFRLIRFLRSKSDLRNIYKKEVISKFFKEYNENLIYEPERKMDESEYRRARFENYDRFYTEDYVSGIMDNDCKLQMAEVETKRKETDREGKTTYTELFHGLFMKIEMPEFITTTIEIRKNEIKLGSRKEKLQMDSEEFEKTYDVYAENKIVGMQLLTADIMQFLIDFQEENKSKAEIIITNNKMYIRLKTNSIFEPNVYKDIMDYSTLQKCYKLMKFIFGITEKLIKSIKETEI